MLSELDNIKRLGTVSGQKIVYLESVMGIPFTYGNQIRVLQNGDEIFPAMLAAVEAAQVCVNFATYVYWTGDIAQRFADVLSRKAQEGVAVRVLLDAVGASRMSDDLLRRMRRAGVEVRWFRPFHKRFWHFDKRAHRKLLICDQMVAFTGGVGIAEEWEGDARDETEWRETHLEFWGECVRFLEAAFWDDWFEVDEDALRRVHICTEATIRERASVDTNHAAVQVVASSPSTHQSSMERLFVALTLAARRRIRIATPYFVLQRRFARLLAERARQGLSVEIMVPGQHVDFRFALWMSHEYMEELLDAGVRIWRYDRTMLHSKIWLLDDDLACVGSPNLNQRSRKKDDEVAALISDEAVVAKLAAAFDDDLQACLPFGPQQIHQPSRLKRLAATLARPLREQF